MYDFLLICLCNSAAQVKQPLPHFGRGNHFYLAAKAADPAIELVTDADGDIEMEATILLGQEHGRCAKALPHGTFQIRGAPQGNAMLRPAVHSKVLAQIGRQVKIRKLLLTPPGRIQHPDPAHLVHPVMADALSAGADVRDYVAAQCTAQKGAAGLSACTDRIFRALSEYCLRTDETLTGTVTLTAGPEGVLFRLNDGADQPLFDLLPAAYTGALDAIRAEINELVGLAPVKEYVFGLADNLQVQQRRAAAGLKTASLSMHMIFTGNPGTGKTTIARLVAKYLKAIGALKGGQLVEVTRADLVGRYTGHTAPLTNSVIESALGGVLFIDEAYSLYRGEQDSFGLEAIDTLVKGMEDHRDELVVILAGYTREMETFLTANSGLASRFPNRIEFPDYTAVELLQITQVLAKNKGYTLAEACTEPLLGYYARWQAADARTAGNGRLARNTLEKAIFHQSRRLVAEPAATLDLILPSDLELKEP